MIFMLCSSRTRTHILLFRSSRPRRAFSWASCVAMFAVLCVGLPAAQAQLTVPSAELPLPGSLVPAVEFWKLVFAEYTSDQVILHDDRHLDVIYGTVDVRDMRAAGASDVAIEVRRRKLVRQEMEALRLALRGDRRASAEHKAKVEQAWLRHGTSPDGNASARVRSQLGLRNRFAEAIEISGMFIPEIERTLERYGVPREVACLPFVESMFNYKARSKVGASGAWQFTRSTGRLFLRIDEAVDERLDVLRAADGAARLLKGDYERIQSWPLALTGYNHGAAGMRRAARRLGTKDIAEVVKRYRSRTFGFASRNFYAEFLAVVMIYQEREKFFPGVEPWPERRFDEFAGDRYFSLQDLALLMEVAPEELIELNQGLSDMVHAGALLVPKGYAIRVPEGQKATALAAYDRIPEARKLARQLAFEYRVKRGDTLGLIAGRHQTSVRALQQANNLPRADRIYVGQRLRIPSSKGFGKALEPLDLAALEAEEAKTRASATNGEEAPANDAPVRTASKEYRVRSGDTLGVIAQREGTTVRALMDANELRSTMIRIGQVLRIPSS